MKRKQPTEEQKQAATERRARVQAVAKRITAMSEEERQSLAEKIDLVMVTGHAVSVRNACLVALQDPGATVLGGFHQWLAVGRAVQKGAKALSIYAPAVGKKDDGETRETFFIPVSVFDVAQTQESRPEEDRR